MNAKLLCLLLTCTLACYAAEQLHFHVRCFYEDLLYDHAIGSRVKLSSFLLCQEKSSHFVALLTINLQINGPIHYTPLPADSKPDGKWCFKTHKRIREKNLIKKSFWFLYSHGLALNRVTYD